jgi:hypothetical protein
VQATPAGRTGIQGVEGQLRGLLDGVGDIGGPSAQSLAAQAVRLPRELRAQASPVSSPLRPTTSVTAPDTPPPTRGYWRDGSGFPTS